MASGSAVSAYGFSVLMLWACGSVVHYGRSLRLRKPVYLMLIEKESHKGLGTQHSLQDMSPETELLIVFFPLKLQLSHVVPQAGDLSFGI